MTLSDLNFNKKRGIYVAISVVTDTQIDTHRTIAVYSPHACAEG